MAAAPPAALTHAQIEAKKRLQQLVMAMVAAAWRGLPHYNRQQIDQFLAAVLPVTAAANQQAVRLTEAYLARALDVPPVGLDAASILAGLRNGTTPAEVYARPFVTVWGALGRGVPWPDAVKLGEQRATSAAATDVQLAFTHTLQEAAGTAGLGDGRIVGYQRVPDDGACEFCLAAAGQIYHSDNLLPIHSLCGCGCEPVTDEQAGGFSNARTFTGPGGLEVAVHDHGELGPVLTNAADHFTGPAALAHTH